MGRKRCPNTGIVLQSSEYLSSVQVCLETHLWTLKLTKTYKCGKNKWEHNKANFRKHF